MTNTNENQQPTAVMNNQQQNVVYGRSAFLVQTTQQGVTVLPVLIDLENQVRHFPGHPAIFPNLQYALAQIDELKSLVIKHFEDAYRQSAQSQQVQGQSTTPVEQSSPVVPVEEVKKEKKKKNNLGEDAS